MKNNKFFQTIRAIMCFFPIPHILFYHVFHVQEDGVETAERVCFEVDLLFLKDAIHKKINTYTPPLIEAVRFGELEVLCKEGERRRPLTFQRCPICRGKLNQVKPFDVWKYLACRICGYEWCELGKNKL